MRDVEVVFRFVLISVAVLVVGMTVVTCAATEPPPMFGMQECVGDYCPTTASFGLAERTVIRTRTRTRLVKVPVVQSPVQTCVACPQTASWIEQVPVQKTITVMEPRTVTATCMTYQETKRPFRTPVRNLLFGKR